MIAYVRGLLEEMETDSVVLEVNGLGYRIFVPNSVLAQLPSKGEAVKLYTYLNVKEDAMQLYGFLAASDLKLFKILISVSGVGPKAGLSILSSMDSETVIFAILSEDVKTLSKAQGVGKKIAQKIILETKDKVGLINEEALLISTKEEKTGFSSSDSHAKNEAIEVLKALGYASSDSFKAVNLVSVTPDMKAEDIVKQALKMIH